MVESTGGLGIERHSTLFNDVHSVLHNVTQDLARLRLIAQANDRARRQEIEAVLQKVEDESREHREELNKARFDFDDFVHSRVSTIVERMEEISKAEQKDEVAKKQKLWLLKEELAKMKESCVQVANRWQNMEQRILNRPSTLQTCLQLEEAGKKEKNQYDKEVAEKKRAMSTTPSSRPPGSPVTR
eukprot:TRINITY_DN9220_c1_g1_i1.p1 TRINITY_DN9220_c1_g1~~TRINITY_DN9220_c1_g1_i1.p1  ORF type:complete len:186 (-),score=51.53 TRINITY_DN9220_c1_g1_i1:192-749(-)